ncbi:MAG: hypothetical protein PUB34_04980 [Clostridia bacterium]|nr:hypothetical protein [Clostridia bacterium]
MLFKKKKSLKRKIAKELDGKYIKVITERKNESEETVGKTGAFIIKGEEILVYSEEKVVFRSLIDDTDFSPLLSLGGVIIHGNDIEHSGMERTLVIYYTYHI